MTQSRGGLLVAALAVAMLAGVLGAAATAATTAKGAVGPATQAVTSPAVTFGCVSGLGRYRQKEIDALSLTLGVTAPKTVAANGTLKLTGTTVTATVPSSTLKLLYEFTSTRYDLVNGGTGISEFPAFVWIAIAGYNTKEGTQVLQATTKWSLNITDPTPANRSSGDEVIPDAKITVALPDSTWTPSGSGDVQFTFAAPGTIPKLTVAGHGEGAGGALTDNPYDVAPLGSAFLRGETKRYGANFDCSPGTVALKNAGIAYSNLGRNPVPNGMAGRYEITNVTAPKIAAVPLETFRVTAGKLAADGKSAVLDVSCLTVARCKGTVDVKTLSKLLIGGKRQFLTLASGSYSVLGHKSVAITFPLRTQVQALLRTTSSGKAALASAQVAVAAHPKGHQAVTYTMRFNGKNAG